VNLLVAILVLPFIGAFLGYYLGYKNENIRNIYNIILTAVELVLIIMIYPELKNGPIEYVMQNIMGTGIHLKVDVFRFAMLFISGLAWFLAMMYSTQYLIKKKKRNRYYFFFMLTYAMTIGVFMSENILNLFTFFEGMSLASYALVIHDEDAYSHDAGRSYIAMAIAGGLVMLLGILLGYDYTGTLDMGDMGAILPTLGPIKYTISLLLLSGFMIKASVFPLHTWLPKAYPAAPAPSSAILSGILLKTGLFGIYIVIIELMAFDHFLSYMMYGLGLVNIFLGGILAMLQRNVKRIIAYSSMSQTGFMLMGIGLIGILGKSGSIALVGTILYMINHAFFKILLFFGAGIVYMILGEMSINKISGFGRKKKKMKLFFLIGVLGVTAMPGFSGFVSKTLLHEAILEAYHHTHNIFFQMTEYLFLIGGGLTVAYMLKLYIALFIEKNPNFYGQYAEQVSKRALLPMGILATLIVFIGLFPNTILAPLFSYADSLGMAMPEHLEVYTASTAAYAGISLIVGIVLYVILIRKKLVVKEGNTRIFVNPSLKWFSIEEDLFTPFLKLCFHVFSFVFHIIDNSLLFTAQKTSDVFTAISDIDAEAAIKDTYHHFKPEATHNMIGQKVYLSKSEGSVSSFNPKEQYQLIKGATKKKVSQKKYKQIAMLKHYYEQFQLNVSGISSAIYIFGFVVVFSMVFIYYFGSHS
jgi:formate hydrogenlyase subunit 3/multisubunit Na+/H+ antiporter MnhD subunit